MTTWNLGRTVFSGLPRAYWILWFAILVNKLGTFVVPFLYLYLTRSEQMSVAQASLVVALYGVGSTFSGPIGGLLADRVGRRATLVVGLVAGALGMVALGLTHAPAVIPVVTLVAGFAAELHRPAAAAMIADVVPPEQRVRAYGLMHWAINLGFAVGLLLAGIMAERSFLLLFLGDAATALACAAIIWRWVPESRAPRARPAGRVLGSLLVPMRDRRFLLLWLLALATAMIYFQFATTLPEALARQGLTTTEYGALVAVTCVVVTVLQPLATPLLQQLRTAHVLAAACLLIGAGFGSVALFSTLPLFMVAGVIWTLGEIAYVAVVPTIVAALAPAELRGGYQGSYQMARGLASFAGPAAGGLVFQHLGGDWLWAGCFVLGVLLAFGHHAYARRIEPRSEGVRDDGVAQDRVDRTPGASSAGSRAVS
jgi:MFS family permease